MNNCAGIWIDHHRATLVKLNDERATVEEVFADTVPPPAWEARRGVAATAHESREATVQDDHRRSAHLHRFYREVISRCDGIDAVYVIGPGMAKRELVRAWRAAYSSAAAPDITIKPAEWMSPEQLLAHVSEFISASASGRRRPTV